MLLFVKKAGLEQIGIPAMLRIEQTAPHKKQQNEKKNTTIHCLMLEKYLK